MTCTCIGIDALGEGGLGDAAKSGPQGGEGTCNLTSQGGVRPKGVRRMDVRGRGYEGGAAPLLRKRGAGENQTRHQ